MAGGEVVVDVEKCAVLYMRDVEERINVRINVSNPDEELYYYIFLTAYISVSDHFVL